MLISSAFGLEIVNRSVRNRRFWRGLQPPRQWMIDRDIALVSAVSMKAVTAEQKSKLH
jgi:hypothetical protein